MDSASAKYQVSLANKNNWFPGHTISTFDFIISKSALVTLPVLEKARDKQGLSGTVIGYVLIEKGTAKKEVVPSKAVKAAGK